MINDKHKFIFMHVPKVAGASIENALKNVSGTTDISMMEQLKRERIVAKTLSENLDYHFFMFVRNPWDRIVSVYRHSMRKRRRFPRLSFSDWLNALRDFYVDKIDDGRLSTFDKRHARRQTAFVPNYDRRYFKTKLNGEVKNIFIGRFEQVSEDFRQVTDWIGLGQLKLSHETWGSCGTVDYIRWYDDETIEKVGELYKSDVEYFGYEFDK